MQRDSKSDAERELSENQDGSDSQENQDFRTHTHYSYEENKETIFSS